MRTRRLLVSGLALMLLMAVAVPSQFARGADDTDIEKMIATAKTPADHEAIATYYDKQAADAKAKAELHRKMGEDYKKEPGGVSSKTHFHQHCESLAKSYASAAKDYSAMAAAHRGMAKKAK